MPDIPPNARVRPPVELKSWLSTALDAWLADGTDHWAFRPFALHIGREPDLAHDLRTIYGEQSRIEQERWRQAARDLLSERGPNPAFRPALEVLLDLATLMPAPNVLDVLPELIADADAPDAARLANRVVGAAVSLASPTTPFAVECLERIRTAPLFAPHHAGLVLTALCRTDPHRWTEHVVSLEPAMRELEDKHALDRGPLRLYASSILRSITVGLITKEALDRLWAGLESVRVPRWNWFCRELFEGKGSLVECGEGWLRLRDGEADQVPYEGKSPLACQSDLEVQEITIHKEEKTTATS